MELERPPRLEFTTRAALAVLVTPTVVCSLFAAMFVLGGAPAAEVFIGLLIVVAAWISVATPFVMLLGLTKDAVVEGRRIMEARRVIRARQADPVAGAVSVLTDGFAGGELAELEDHGDRAT